MKSEENNFYLTIYLGYCSHIRGRVMGFLNFKSTIARGHTSNKVDLDNVFF